MTYTNTLDKGSVRYIIFQEDGVWYGVALEFNIVEEGDDPLEVMASLFQAMDGYVETAKKLKMRPQPLNQEADSEYQTLWQSLQTRKQKKAGHKRIYSFGFTHPYAVNTHAFASA